MFDHIKGANVRVHSTEPTDSAASDAAEALPPLFTTNSTRAAVAKGVNIGAHANKCAAAAFARGRLAAVSALSLDDPDQPEPSTVNTVECCEPDTALVVNDPPTGGARAYKSGPPAPAAMLTVKTELADAPSSDAGGAKAGVLALAPPPATHSDGVARRIVTSAAVGANTRYAQPARRDPRGTDAATDAPRAELLPIATEML